jgi:hypothetical protein
MCQLRPNVFSEVAERERLLLGFGGAATAATAAASAASAASATAGPAPVGAPDAASGGAVPAAGRIEAH